MKVLVTGANGFIGKNLVLRLREQADTEVLTFARGDSDAALHAALTLADAVIHLAGENRPASPDAFEQVNAGLSRQICDGLRALSKPVPLLLASSAQAELDNPYGRSKLAAEQAVQQLANDNGNPVAIYRLPGVFGKWCRPNYNSVVATFCHHKAHDLPLQINDANTRIRLVYVDDVISAFLYLLVTPWSGLMRPLVTPEYSITLGELSALMGAIALPPVAVAAREIASASTTAAPHCSKKAATVLFPLPIPPVSPTRILWALLTSWPSGARCRAQ